MNPKVKNIQTEILSDNWYTLNKIDFDYQLKNGDWVRQSRESYDRGNGACILLYNTNKKTVVLIKQFRMPSYVNGNDTGMMIEVCAGLLDGDDPETCIIKETEEETGYKIKNVKKVFESYMSPGAVTEIIHFFVAEYDDKMKVSEGGGLEVEHEDIEVLEFNFETALKMIENGDIKDAKTIMLLQFAKIQKIID
jgi:nudix-type nucleoside diphosphatase (YffH/AdpP family)